MREIDYSKPLSEEDEAYLRERLPDATVDHLKAKAAGAEQEDSRLLAELVDPDGALAASEAARSDAAAEKAEDKKAMEEGDDPSDFNTRQVNAYLKEASDEERERVLAAEKDGKARQSIVGD